MIRPKLGLKVLSLCALVFALVSIVSSGAQAASWLVLEGANVTEGVGGEVTLAVDTTAILHSKISGTAVLFECPTIAAVGAKLEAGGKIAKGAKIKFSGCKTKLNGLESKACEPTNAGTEKGVIVTKAGHAEVKGESIEVIPDEGETLTTMEMGKECSIGTKVPVIGKLLLKDCEEAFLTHKESHLLELSASAELFIISKTEEHKVTPLGSAFAKVLTGGVFRSYAGHAS